MCLTLFISIDWVYDPPIYLTIYLGFFWDKFICILHMHNNGNLNHISKSWLTLSLAASDDEGSTAATDGSTLRTSPAEHAGSGGSESGGSAVDSITGEHSGKKGTQLTVMNLSF